MAARGLLSKTVFQPNLVSCLQYRLFLPSKTSNIQAISDEKKNMCWNVNKNCDADLDIDRVGYQSEDSRSN